MQFQEKQTKQRFTDLKHSDKETKSDKKKTFRTNQLEKGSSLSHEKLKSFQAIIWSLQHDCRSLHAQADTKNNSTPKITNEVTQRLQEVTMAPWCQIFALFAAESKLPEKHACN